MRWITQKEAKDLQKALIERNSLLIRYSKCVDNMADLVQDTEASIKAFRERDDT